MGNFQIWAQIVLWFQQIKFTKRRFCPRFGFPEDGVNPFTPLGEMLLTFQWTEEKQMLTTGFDMILYMWKKKRKLK